MRRARPRRDAGFTLVEMLVALLIFGMLTAGGVALLSFSIRAQELADDRLAGLSSLRRSGLLLNADLGQAVARLWRDDQGRQQPAFVGNPSSEQRLVVLVRAGWDNPDRLPRGSLQRVEYRVQDGRLLRIGFANVDGGGASQVVTLLDGVERYAIRYRDREGQWRADWQPVNPAELPVAMELIVATQRFGEVRQVFMVGATG